MSEERGETVDLAFIGRALQRLTNEIASLRDDMHVLAAIVHRLDNSHSRLLEEIRATHSQSARLANRGRKLEEESAAGLSRFQCIGTIIPMHWNS
jgi:t-SNARE complex subunit (syntaxin)